MGPQPAVRAVADGDRGQPLPNAAGAPFAAAQATLRELADVLGLHLEATNSATQDIAPFVELLIETRTALRKAKQFELADTIRKRLLDLGVTLEDGSQGTRWKVTG